MIRLVTLVISLGAALAVAQYYGLGSIIQLLTAIAIAFALMRLLSSRRVH